MPAATHIYHNGTILTMDSRASTVSCLAVRGDRIAAVGGPDDVAPLRGPDTRLVDLKGRTMLPGFYDCHSHYMRAGMYNALYLDAFAAPIGGLKTLAELAGRIRAGAEKTPKGEWLLCAGYDDTGLAEKRHFSLAELDALVPEHPLFLRHISGHSALCNSLALAAAGIGPDTPDPAGGLFRRGPDGALTGLVEEPAAMDRVLEAAPAMTGELWLISARRACEDYLAKGVTTAHDGGVTTAMWHNYFKAHAAGIIRNRVQLLPKHGLFDFSLAPRDPAPGTWLTGDGKLSLGAVKLFQDGSIQGYTGYLSNPYHKLLDAGLPGQWRGYAIHTRAALAELVTDYHKKGWQVAVHANGDAAIDDVLEAYELAQRALPDVNRRHIVIHCQTAREDQLDRIRRLGVVPSFFVVHTYYWGDRHHEIFLGPGRAGRINPLRSALERRIPFTNHNDSAVTPMDPLLSVWSAVNRRTASGRVLGEEQTIPVLEALRSVTTWGARQFHEERIKGSLEPGKLADMTILAENPLTVAPPRLRGISVAGVLVGNELVFGEC